MNRIHAFLFSIIILFSSTYSFAQSKVERIEPPNWWVGMNNSSLQLLMYGKSISRLQPVIKYPGIKIDSIKHFNNPNYLFVYINISPETKPGNFKISLRFEDEQVTSVSYELKNRKPDSQQRKSFDQSDVVYLLMPDRFANGDPSNDSIQGMLEKPNRLNPDGRHGGDLKGIEDHLDYFSKLGMTALWLNPFQENNMSAYSYHGYAITDYYKTDPRFGSNEEFLTLVKKAHQSQLKIIMDMVFNHCGSNHWFIKDLPTNDWIHQFDTYTRSNFKAPVSMDMYASTYDKNLLQNGWFDRMMPDLNQKNPHLAAYLIQNSIWWIEYADLDGIRMDTHMYADPEFMARWCKSVNKEYPDFKIVGELWIETKALHAYWMKDSPNSDGYNSELDYLTDFPMYVSLRQAMQEETGWETGAERLYYSLAQDILYKKPQDNMIFLSNHDVTQFYTTCGEDFGKYCLGVAFFFTTRGIPQFYQGTEILMTGHENGGHGKMRKDFPGGWPGDISNAFESAGRTEMQQKAWDYVQKIANWRKTSEAVKYGKLMQFIPDNQVYVYFRYNANERIMIALNFSKNEKQLSSSRYNEMLSDCKRGTDIITGNLIQDLKNIAIPAQSAMIIELHK